MHKDIIQKRFVQNLVVITLLLLAYGGFSENEKTFAANNCEGSCAEEFCKNHPGINEWVCVSDSTYSSCDVATHNCIWDAQAGTFVNGALLAETTPEENTGTPPERTGSFTPSNAGTTHAAEEGDTGCASFSSAVTSPKRCIYNMVRNAIPDVDISSTVSNIFAALVTDVPMQLVFGRSVDQMHACVAEDAGIAIPADIQKIQDNEDCSDLQINPESFAYGQIPTSSKVYRSALGLPLMAQYIDSTQPVPVNLAFYANHVASNTLLIRNTALASSGVGVGSIIMDMSLNIWEQMRNISYGLLAIFMLYIGVMIMMRKNIDPRTTVTVQNAIPKIVIALVLITFSYALGSLGAALVNPLSEAIKTLINGLPLTPTGGANWVWTLIALTWIAFPITGVIGVVIILIAVLVLIVILLTVLIKIQITYIKIALHVIIGPLQFAWGAIPGNEETVQNWFKKLGALVLTVPAMRGMLAIAKYVTQEAYAYTATWQESSALSTNENLLQFGSTMVIALAIPLIVIFILAFAAKMPKKIEEAFMGPIKR